MIKFENFEVTGWEHAIRGMRNPLNSWEKSDSCSAYDNCIDCPIRERCDEHIANENFNFTIGPNDYELMMKLRNAGTDHRKFMRMITVYVDITAPLYWWKEFDTYKVGTVVNSCSTMHTIHKKEFELDDFSMEHLVGIDGLDGKCAIHYTDNNVTSPRGVLSEVIRMLNLCRGNYLETKDKRYWWQMIQLLPTSYNQKRTVMMNYEVLANIHKSRKSHRLDEWEELCAWAETLPYSELISGYAVSKETSFQEDLDFFVNDCTMAQLHALRAAVEARINEAIESKIITMPCGCTFEGGTGTAPDGTQCGECHPGYCDTCPYLKKLEDKCGD